MNLRKKRVTPTPNRRIRPAKLGILLSAAIASCSVVPVFPPAASAESTAQTTSIAERQIAFAIPSQSLNSALLSFGDSAGVQLIYDAALVQNLRSTAVHGTYSLSAGLGRLLAGTGISFKLSGNNGVTLEKIHQKESNITLDPVKVAGDKAGGNEGEGDSVALAPVKVKAKAERSGTTEGSGSYTTRSMSSATHLPLSMRETPQSVTVLTNARIEADNLVDLVDIAKATPGLMIEPTGPRPLLLSRGYEVENVTQDGIATRYDWYKGDSLGNLAMQDRVEVVRGATGLMQGAGNPSAAINMIRKRPTSTWQLNGTASTGSWDDYRLMADVSGPLMANGRVRGRVVGSFQDAGDFYDLGFNDKYLGYATVDIDLTNHTTLNLGYAHLYSNKNMSWGGIPTSYGYQHRNLPRSTFVSTDWEYNKNEADTLYVSLIHDFGKDWNLNFNGTYVDGRYDLLATFLIPTPDVGGYGHVWWAGQTSREQIAGDLKLSGPVSFFGRTHDLVFGATTNRQDSRDSEWWQGWDAPLTSGIDLATWNHVIPRPDTSSTSPWLTKYSTYYKQDSLYFAGRINLINGLDLLLGERLDWYKRGDSLGGTSYSVNAHLTNYAGLTWKFVNNHTAYVSYTDVFQPQNQRDLNGNVISPKSGKNYELGVKGEYFGGALNGSIALFRIDESNRAVYLDDQTGCPTAEGCYTAAGLVRTEGVDVELQGAITPDWQIGAGLTWSESRYRSDANPANIGKRLSTMNPTTLFKLSTQYTLPGVLNQLTLGGRLSWQSKMYRDFENYYGDTVRNEQAAYAVVDLSASYRLTKNLNIKLDINNLFDEKYYSNISGHWYWAATETYGRPRSFMTTLKYTF